MSNPNKLMRGIGRQKLGSFFVDTGTLLLADPCKVLPDEDGPRITYDSLLELWNAGDTSVVIGGMSMPVQQSHQFVAVKDARGNNGAIAVSVGNDGWYPVFFERDESGAERIVIELGGQVKP